MTKFKRGDVVYSEDKIIEILDIELFSYSDIPKQLYYVGMNLITGEKVRAPMFIVDSDRLATQEDKAKLL